MQPTIVLKVGGAELADQELLARFVQETLSIASKARLVIVHGGGPEIAEMQETLGLEPKFAQGLRITDEDSLRVAEMVLSGLVNKRLSGALATAGVAAIGLSGVDACLFLAERLTPHGDDIGWVGEIQSVNADLIRNLLQLDLIPVLSPISIDTLGQHYNVNADAAAVGVAQALAATELVFLTNVPGLLYESTLLEHVSDADIARLIGDGTITGGMIPKTQAAAQATHSGVACVRITNLDGLAANRGTRITSQKEEHVE